jgi:CDP-4-dehydro-6-deoxyglucose reductase, E3
MTAQTTYQVTLRSGTTFPARADQTVLEAALAAGVTLAYGCRNGACGACKGALVTGELIYGDYQDKALPAVERAAGRALFCCSRPGSDLTIDAREVNSTKDIIVKSMPARVEKIERPVDDVVILYLKLPAAERLQFMAGQYIDILMKDGKRRSYSMANAPHDDSHLQLHIRKSPNGAFSQYVFEQMKERAILRLEGPLGTFFLREDSDKPIVFMAGGTGFAPIKAIVEHAFMKHINRQMVLYWGVRTENDLYMPDLPMQWQRENPNFTFIPVVSDPIEGMQWQGRTGFVHEAIADDFPDLAGYCVYACGGPAMIDAAKAAFFAQGLPEAEFYCDSFTPAVDPKTTATVGV